MTEAVSSGVWRQLCWAMVKTGILGYGGGPSVIPLIRHEAVARHQWMSDEEFGEILAFANALPGPIATKIAAYLGYRLKGTGGATVAVLAHIMPSAVAMIALLSAVNFLSSSPIVQGMIGAVIPVIAVMLGMMAYEFGERALRGSGKVLGVIFFACAFILLQLLDVHPALVIMVFLLYGAFHFKLRARLEARQEQKR
ncbi:chromate transporter [Paenibacillus sp. SYP-B4298]|uniref:chromate transporter n=1 Tax=Paenibacillus sp. SYP-B4298 TaxID=2996034 RepID=UPI0022DE599A|nr:chromate transporter [Paenibacillus sp. SYP-B4298]